jgi:diadenylate cyclase
LPDFIAVREWLAEHFNLPWVYLPAIGLTEAADIFIVACMVYLMLHWIRRTRAWTLFKGLVIILALAALANVFNLVTVLWIVQIAFTMGVVLVVLFQTEMRNALEQIGRGRYLNFAKQADENRHWSLHTVNELVKASRSMSVVKTGALIVMGQEVRLDEQVRTGIPIDALVSSQLIMNIFEKNAPLHDGAVVIARNRVMAAACILPLSTYEIGHDLGTRHRAAVGMSEVSDAMVIVVSEETGSVSLARDGQLIRDIDENRLRDILMQGDYPKNPRFQLFKYKSRQNRD